MKEKFLELLKSINREGIEDLIKFIENSDFFKAPASTIAGLNSFDEEIILLAGGSDKGLDYKEVGEAIAKKVKTIILCGPTSQKIENSTKEALKNMQKEIKFIYSNSMEESVQIAYREAKDGDGRATSYGNQKENRFFYGKGSIFSA